MKKILMLSLVILVTVIFSGCFQGNSNQENKATVQGEVTEKSAKTTVYFFWGDGCPHCEEQKPFLEDMKNKYPELEVRMLEVYKNKENLEVFKKMAEAYGIQAQGVPATFIGDLKPVVGYTESMKGGIESKISECIKNDCIDPGTKIK